MLPLDRLSKNNYEFLLPLIILTVELVHEPWRGIADKISRRGIKRVSPKSSTSR
jgi:hypothetical protein